MDQLGTFDFYANGGENQPGCSITSFHYNFTNLGSSLTDEIDCSHNRAIYLFNDALLSNSCESVGYQCPNVEQFNRVNDAIINKDTILPSF